MVAALIVGGMTAWYCGVRSGVLATALTAGALLVAALVPGLTFVVYGLVIAWVAALLFFGPKIAAELRGPARFVVSVTRAIKQRKRR